MEKIGRKNTGISSLLLMIVIVSMVLALIPIHLYAWLEDEEDLGNIREGELIIVIEESSMPLLDIHEENGIWYWGDNLPTLNEFSDTYQLEVLNTPGYYTTDIFGRTFRGKFNTETSSYELDDIYEADAHVEFAIPNYIFYFMETREPNDPYYANPPRQLGYNIIRAAEGWFEVFGEDPINLDEEVIIAYIDSGIDLFHPDLVGPVGENPSVETCKIYMNVDPDNPDLDEDANNNGTTIVWDPDLRRGGLEGGFKLDPLDLEDVNDGDGNEYLNDLAGWSLVDSDEEENMGNPDIQDSYSHGTMVAGILGALTDNNLGVASLGWNIKILPLRIRHEDNVEHRALWEILRAFRYVRNCGIENIVAVSISMGDCDDDPVRNFELAQETRRYVDALTEARDLVIVAAAGNYLEQRPWPAGLAFDFPDPEGGDPLPACPNVIAISATDAETDVVMPWVNNAGEWISMSAPGNETFTTNLPHGGYQGLYYRFGGTSLSAPLVAASIGLLKRRFEDIPIQHDENNDNARDRILSTADNLNGINENYHGLLGTGRLNLERALGIEDPQPNLQFFDIAINDDDFGNGDGLLNVGESVTFQITVKNIWDDATNVTGNLTENDPYVSVEGDEDDFDGLNHMETAQGGEYSMDISDNCPANYELQLIWDMDCDQIDPPPEQIHLTVHPYIPEGFPLVLPNIANTLSPVLFDYEGDGNHEILVGTAGENQELLLVIEGDGEIENEIEINGPLTAPPAVGDLDGDFDPDIAVFLVSDATEDPQLRVYRNTGNPYNFNLISTVNLADELLNDYTCAALGGGDLDATRNIGDQMARLNALRVAAELVDMDPASNIPKAIIPERFEILGAYPNPFNSSVAISYGLPNTETVTITIFDLNGRQVAKLFEGKTSAGFHRQYWNAGGAPSGVYLCRIEAGLDVQSVRLSLVK